MIICKMSNSRKQRQNQNLGLYREEIASLKERLAEMNIQLIEEKEKAEDALFGKEKLISVNKALMDEVKKLKNQNFKEEYIVKVCGYKQSLFAITFILKGRFSGSCRLVMNLQIKKQTTYFTLDIFT